ncbi:MAG: hypothetical protein L3V56_07655 [Candidatus Magnetoovum sp. WYHC-5]|nr:hypothetical protein [Candidatus Magnetoovum sp. WYHC-5]
MNSRDAIIFNKKGVISKRLVMVITSVLVLLTFVYFGLQLYLISIAKKNVNQFISYAKPYMDIKYKNVRVELFKTMTYIDSVEVNFPGSNEHLQIQNIALHSFDYANKPPHYMNIAFNGIDLNKTGSILNNKEVKKLGYSNVKGQLAMNYKYMKETQDLSLEQFNIKIHEMGSININFLLSNFNIEQNNYLTALLSLMATSINRANISYTDDSLMQRLMVAAANEKGTDVDNLKKEIISELNNVVKDKDAEFERKIVTPVRNFIEKPNRIAITIKPAKPVQIKDINNINNPDELIKMLNLTVEN